MGQQHWQPLLIEQLHPEHPRDIGAQYHPPPLCVGYDDQEKHDRKNANDHQFDRVSHQRQRLLSELGHDRIGGVRVGGGYPGSERNLTRGRVVHDLSKVGTGVVERVDQHALSDGIKRGSAARAQNHPLGSRQSALGSVIGQIVSPALAETAYASPF